MLQPAVTATTPGTACLSRLPALGRLPLALGLDPAGASTIGGFAVGQMQLVGTPSAGALPCVFACRQGVAAWGPSLSKIAEVMPRTHHTVWLSHECA